MIQSRIVISILVKEFYNSVSCLHGRCTVYALQNL